MAGTVGWKSLGPMLLTVTRPVAAEGLDPGPPCEDRRWQSNHSLCLGGWRPAISASCWQEHIRHLCHLKSRAWGKACVFYKKGTTKRMRICALTHTRAASAYTSECLLLHSTAESCDTAKCELCTCPWNDHRQPESPWRNNLVKSKANKFTHHCQFPIH